MLLGQPRKEAYDITLTKNNWAKNPISTKKTFLITSGLVEIEF